MKYPFFSRIIIYIIFSIKNLMSEYIIMLILHDYFVLKKILAKFSDK